VGVTRQSYSPFLSYEPQSNPQQLLHFELLLNDALVLLHSIDGSVHIIEIDGVEQRNCPFYDLPCK
jgi:hypothetical protein